MEWTYILSVIRRWLKAADSPCDRQHKSLRMSDSHTTWTYPLRYHQWSTPLGPVLGIPPALTIPSPMSSVRFRSSSRSSRTCRRRWAHAPHALKARKHTTQWGVTDPQHPRSVRWHQLRYWWSFRLTGRPQFPREPEVDWDNQQWSWVDQSVKKNAIYLSTIWLLTFLLRSIHQNRPDIALWYHKDLDLQFYDRWVS